MMISFPTSLQLREEAADSSFAATRSEQAPCPGESIQPGGLTWESAVRRPALFEIGVTRENDYCPASPP